MSSAIAHYLNMMTQNNNDFFKQLGSKIASFRKELLFPNLQPKEPLLFSQTTIQMPILRTTLI